MGRISGYIQPVSIGYYCSFSAIVHEIGHVLGLWHEQSHLDKHKYIIIHEENIHPGLEPNFDKETVVSSLGVPYDINSIMHYNTTAFTLPNTITVPPKEKDFPLGLAPELSPSDIKQINLLYNHQCG